METPYIMHSSLRDINPSSSAQRGGNQYLVGDYRSVTDVNVASGSSLPLYEHQHTFPAFAGTGVYLVIVHLRLIDSTRSEHSGREPQQINKLKGVLRGSDDTDVLRDGQPYGVWPAEIVHQCDDHVHTVSGSPSFQGIASSDTGAGVIGGSRRWQVDQQAFFIVDARRGDRLFIYRDFVPYTALNYEIVRLAPALMRYGAIEI
jgi:hypothetical protein